MVRRVHPHSQIKITNPKVIEKVNTMKQFNFASAIAELFDLQLEVFDYFGGDEAHPDVQNIQRVLEQLCVLSGLTEQEIMEIIS